MGCCSCGDDDEGTDGGKPLTFDPDFKGPIRGKQRYPTDLPCLIVFIAFVIGFFAIAVYAWAEGNPQRLLYPVDSNGRLCGFTEDVREKPFLLFFDWTACVRKVDVAAVAAGNFEASDLFTCPTQQVCVTSCPDANEIGIVPDPICVDGVETSQFLVLNSTDPLDADEIITATATLVDLILEEKCAPYYIISTDIAGRCIPTFTDLDNIVQLANVTNFNESAVPDLSELVFSLSLEDILNGTLTQALVLNAQLFLYNVYRDLEVVWPAILIGSVVCVILCYVYVILMRCFAGPVICVGIFLALALVAAISGFSFFQYYCLNTGALSLPSFTSFFTNTSEVDSFLNTSESIAIIGCEFTDPLRDFFATNSLWYEYQMETWLAAGIISAVVLLVLIFLLILFCNKIRISIQIITESSKAIGYIPGVVFYPLVTWTLLVVLFIYWAVVSLFLLTSSTPQHVISISDQLDVVVDSATGANYTSGDLCDLATFGGSSGDNNTKIIVNQDTGLNVTVSCMFNRFFTSDFVLGLQVYNLFGLLWIGNYFVALGECTIAGAFASYFWAWNKKKDIPLLTTGASFARAFLFHSGSLSFGALIIAIIQLIRITLAYIQKKLKGNSGKIAQAILTCMQCCFFILEKVLHYINKQAYIEIAIYGYSFCRAACKAVKLILRNPITTAFKEAIVSLLLFMGKLAIVGMMAVLSYLAFGAFEEQGRILWQRELNYYLVPMIIIIFLSYLIASGFLSVYGMGVDTLYICALEDQERNNGFDKPYFMSKKMQKLLNVHNRVEGPDGSNGERSISMERLDKKD